MRISDWSSDVCSSDLDRSLSGLRVGGRGAIEVVPAHRGDVGRGLGQRAVGVEGEAGFGMNELRYLILFNEVEHPVVLGAMHLHEPRPWIVLFFQAQQRIPSGTLCFRFVLAPGLAVGPPQLGRS